MKTNLINKVNAAGTIHLSKGLVIKYLQELVIAAQVVTTNVHHPDYMKKEEIVECYEKITGEKFSKSFVKTHKREDFIDLASDTICEELSAYTDEMVEPELKPKEVNEMLVGKEIGFEVPGVVGEDKVAAGFPTPVSDLKVSEVKADVNLPLYIKEENCDIEAAQVVARPKPKSDIPVLSEEQAKAIMTKVIRLASKNIVKCFIPKRMVESVIMEELFGQNLASKPLEQYSKEDFAIGKAAAAQISQVGLTAYKSGFLIKPVCMAGAYKNSLIKYQAKNLTCYILNTKDKTIMNTQTGEIVDATCKNCSYLNDARLINIIAV